MNGEIVFRVRNQTRPGRVEVDVPSLDRLERKPIHIYRLMDNGEGVGGG